MRPYLKARSPAKLILSGEHAVLYGQPAIAMAIDRYAESTILPNLSPSILFNAKNLQYAKSFTLHALQILKERLQNQYHLFLEGRCSIREVLRKPLELLQYTVSHLLERWNVHLSEGLEIRSNSNIPIGCGMGSSAAIVMSTLYALAHFLKLEIQPSHFLMLGREVENLQHGYSSGLDLHLTLNGGCLKFQNGQAAQCALSPTLPLSIIQTGTPLSTTGECVSWVAPHFKNSTLAEDFGAVTHRLEAAIERGDFEAIQQAIRLNHQLLVKLGVVPEKARALIHQIEAEGGAAKISGAGAVYGETAGVVLVVSKEDHTSLVETFGYTLEAVRGNARGTYLL